MRSLYHQLIKAATGCEDIDLGEIEELMREEIFHSTLDWQSKAQFNRGARKAHKLLLASR